MKVNKIRSNLIKPHTPTPQNLKNYQISFVDQFIRPMNIAVILFYELKPRDYIRQLEESLAKTLVEFYILAGRYIKNDHIVDCSDQGAEFVEAEVLEIELLLDLLAKNEAKQFNALLPPQYFRVDEVAHHPLLAVQATHFPCGRAAIAISVSHRVFDISSLGTFITFWSNVANPDGRVDFTPTFNIPSLLPYWDLDLGHGFEGREAEKVDVKRLLFDGEALTSLKSEINRETVSAVCIACVVIVGALIRMDWAKHGQHRDLLTFQLINICGRTVPPRPKHVCGNFTVPSHVWQITASRSEIRELVAAIGDGVRSSISEYAEILSPDKDGRGIIMTTLGNVSREIQTPEMNVLVFSDWSKFGFYGVDFGWRKPVWTGIGLQRPYFGSIFLMSDKDGNGIEA